jgi:ParB family transcriptional regulator, chromosome partitioning protein
MEEARPRLGRGLAALLGESAASISTGPAASSGARQIAIDLVRPSASNPRLRFDDEALRDLADSIRAKGLIQPIIVRPAADTPGRFEIIAGERRWRAAQLAGVHEIPVVIHDVNDREALEMAIVENVQRSDLNQIEEARGYSKLIDDFGYTQNDLARVIGKSRSHIANIIRLLQLPENVQKLVRSGELSGGHARALLAFSDPEAMASRILSENLNVRQVEELAREPAGDSPASGVKRSPRDVDPNIRELERIVSDALGLKVKLSHRGEGGDIRIYYNDIDQLENICEKLKN